MLTLFEVQHVGKIILVKSWGTSGLLCTLKSNACGIMSLSLFHPVHQPKFAIMCKLLQTPFLWKKDTKMTYRVYNYSSDWYVRQDKALHHLKQYTQSTLAFSFAVLTQPKRSFLKDHPNSIAEKAHGAETLCEDLELAQSGRSDGNTFRSLGRKPPNVPKTNIGPHTGWVASQQSMYNIVYFTFWALVTLMTWQITDVIWYSPHKCAHGIILCEVEKTTNEKHHCHMGKCRQEHNWSSSGSSRLLTVSLNLAVTFSTMAIPQHRW